MSQYVVVDPFTGCEHRRFPGINDRQLDDLVAQAASAVPVVARSTSADRSGLLAKVADLYVERCSDLAEISVMEMGKPIAQAIHEIEFTASIFRYYATNADDLLADEPILVRDGRGEALLRRAPLGVILGVMPWNYPYYQAARFAAPNVLVGNSVLLKPAPQCPESAAAMQQVMQDAGAPDGVYSTILASDEQVVSLLENPDVQGVSVTGSERAGAAIAEVAGRNLKKVVLELGGSDPFIVFSTGDLDATVYHAATTRLENTGQACNAAKRYIVHDDIYDEFAARLVELFGSDQLRPADPRLEETMIGPVSSTVAADRLADQLARGLEQGARVLVGGQRDGNLFAPTVLVDVTADNDIYHEEVFGPIAVLHRVSSEGEAIALANDTPFGLGAYVFSADLEQAERVADRLQTGMVTINLAHGEAPELPFGGVKRSGYGRELGRLGVDEFVNKRLVRKA
ncbi:succinate-semialdehyde dehydrogenase [Nocardioides aromaticivorans]|uniref:Succinate-semialdehyde dehydrogenase n=1 Tax=Nocardioides aromaticivorans TaxID=200618 RepID=A0ABX7PRL3_9ACTN|nr:aldehyde dehydrogenase family protein [Nocardioides aromaticivorans]QSR28449.1 succinate-semialdehyde dehydrogenase [Nocardioides aromaticivorans]